MFPNVGTPGWALKLNVDAFDVVRGKPVEEAPAGGALKLNVEEFVLVSGGVEDGALPRKPKWVEVVCGAAVGAKLEEVVLKLRVVVWVEGCTTAVVPVLLVPKPVKGELDDEKLLPKDGFVEIVVVAVVAFFTGLFGTANVNSLVPTLLLVSPLVPVIPPAKLNGLEVVAMETAGLTPKFTPVCLLPNVEPELGVVEVDKFGTKLGGKL